MNSELGSLVSGCEVTTSVTNLPMSYAGAEKHRPEVSEHTLAVIWMLVSSASPVLVLRPNVHSVIVFRGGPFGKLISIFIEKAHLGWGFGSVGE